MYQEKFSQPGMEQPAAHSNTNNNSSSPNKSRPPNTTLILPSTLQGPKPPAMPHHLYSHSPQLIHTSLFLPHIDTISTRSDIHSPSPSSSSSSHSAPIAAILPNIHDPKPQVVLPSIKTFVGSIPIIPQTVMETTALHNRFFQGAPPSPLPPLPSQSPVLKAVQMASVRSSPAHFPAFPPQHRNLSRGRSYFESTAAAPVAAYPGNNDIKPTKKKSNNRSMFQCSICNRVVTRSTSLHAHMLIHTKVRPFKCDWENCGKTFNVKSNLNRHIKLHKKKESLHRDKKGG